MSVNPNIYDVHPLFEDVQMSRVFPDGKTFVDCRPRSSPEEINDIYLAAKKKGTIDLKTFILQHFELPITPSGNYSSNSSQTVEENIENLWPFLTRQPDKTGGSLIPLPHPYVVPGGRFGEIYYWDSYFTMLGLKASGKAGMIENMVDNFSYLIDTFGYIPNGNRSYFIGRSQPPFYSMMVRMLSEIKGKDVLVKYLPALEMEYRFWMKGAKGAGAKAIFSSRTSRMPGGEILNRYWDENDSPRPESYREDVELARESEQDPQSL